MKHPGMGSERLLCRHYANSNTIGKTFTGAAAPSRRISGYSLWKFGLRRGIILIGYADTIA
jgi:hypothetical protein